MIGSCMYISYEKIENYVLSNCLPSNFLSQNNNNSKFINRKKIKVKYYNLATLGKGQCLKN